jgi:hypothetical protein
MRKAIGLHYCQNQPWIRHAPLVHSGSVGYAVALRIDRRDLLAAGLAHARVDTYIALAKKKTNRSWSFRDADEKREPTLSDHRNRLDRYQSTL